MRYTFDKAIELFKIEKLTSKERKELFQKVLLHPTGPWYAKRLLLRPELLSSDERYILICTLLRKEDLCARYFLYSKGEYSEIEKELLLKSIAQSTFAMYNLIFEAFEHKIIIDTEDLLFIIKNYKKKEDYQDKKLYYIQTIQMLINYILEFCKNDLELLKKEIIKNYNIINIIIFDLGNKLFNDIANKYIYKQYSKQFFDDSKNSIERLEKYCSYFYKFINDKEKTIFVNKIITKQAYLIASIYLQKNNIEKLKFNEKLIAKLEALMVFKTLSGG